MINDYTIYAEGGAWDLLTGEERPFNFRRSYGCGVLASSKHSLLFRSATLGFFDLDKNEKSKNYGGVRPGCWINAIPAGGVVLVPDASAGCECSYQNKAWFALEPVGDEVPMTEKPANEKPANEKPANEKPANETPNKETSASSDVPLHTGVVARFATETEGQAALLRSDSFTQSLSEFDRQVRLKTERKTTNEALLKMMAAEVRPWSDQERARLSAIVAAMRVRLDRWQLPLPKTVLLVKTTGAEESGAAYCRGNAIVLPQGMIDQNPQSLQQILTHELFHVLSSHNPKLRDRLYEIVGFLPSDPVPLPAGLKNRKITNPDAPLLDHIIKLQVDGQTVAAVPLLHSPVPYNAQRGGSLFRYMKFQLLVVERDSDKGAARWKPVLKDGQPVLLNPSLKELPSYHEQIGRNTGYIIHAEEILADNFRLLVGPTTKKIPTPRILESIDTVLNSDAAELSDKPQRGPRRHQMPR